MRKSGENDSPQIVALSDDAIRDNVEWQTIRDLPPE